MHFLPFLYFPHVPDIVGMIHGLLYFKLSPLPYRCHFLNFRLKQLTTSTFNLWQNFHNILETNSSFGYGCRWPTQNHPIGWGGGDHEPTTPMHPRWETVRREFSAPVSETGDARNHCSRAEAKDYGDEEHIPCIELSDLLNSILFDCWGWWGFQIIQKLKNLSLGMIFLPC